MKFIITGGRPLHGEVVLAGSKNTVTKLLVASLLTSDPVVIENVPIIGDVDITLELCRTVGSVIEFDKDKKIIRIATPQITNPKVVSLSRRNRIPILALGPLLARVGEAEVPIVGGDKIGPRPVDIHLGALTAMGAEIETTLTSYKATAPKGLHGTKINLRYPSVGATENTILAAVLAKGKTTIHNAAVEPEIIEVVKMLQKMGAIIELGANRVVHIEGVARLRGTRHEVMSDRNEAVSFACLAVATNGKLLIRRARQQDLITFLNVIRRVGGEYRVVRQGIVFYRATPKLCSVALETDTHPGFMTDWQQPFVALLTQANGESALHETVYEDRLGYTYDLNLMGANITVVTACRGELTCRFVSVTHPHSAIVRGLTPLHGAKLIVRDLRAGMLNITAALMANGVSEISGIEEIDRGYMDIDGRLRNLGADIKRMI